MNTTIIPQDVWHVWLVRHGQTLWNEEGRFCGHSDIPLSARGRAQAQWLATRLQHLISRPVHVYASDLMRARETADTIAVPFAASVELSTVWREIDFGAFEGLTYQEVEARYPEYLGFFMGLDEYTPLHGEALLSVVQRTHHALTHILHEQSPSHDIIIVSHGGALRGLLCTLLGMPLHHQWQLRIDLASISAIDLSFDEDESLLATLCLLNMSEKYTGMVQ